MDLRMKLHLTENKIILHLYSTKSMQPPLDLYNHH